MSDVVASGISRCYFGLDPRKLLSLTAKPLVLVAAEVARAQADPSAGSIQLSPKVTDYNWRCSRR